MSSAVVPSSAASASGADVVRSFLAVFIPSDPSRSVEQWKIDYTNVSEVSCLMDRLKAHFAAGGMKPEDQAALREKVRAQIKETMAKQNPSAASAPIDDAMVNMILQMSSVDCVPLQNNKHSTGYIGLMMYVDDQGKAKNLPVNERATRSEAQARGGECGGISVAREHYSCCEFSAPILLTSFLFALRSLRVPPCLLSQCDDGMWHPHQRSR